MLSNKKINLDNNFKNLYKSIILIISKMTNNNEKFLNNYLYIDMKKGERKMEVENGN